MAQCVLKNNTDHPLSVQDPDSGEVYCILPGFGYPVKEEWPDVRKAIREQRGMKISSLSSGKMA